jgi:anti-sigma factor RsiW
VTTPDDVPRAAGASDDRALLGAYVDGVAELTPDERRAAEAWLVSDPAARAEADALRGLVDQLRALPPAGDEPDWSAMERAIRHAVDGVPARPWWRRGRWWMPALTCATAAAVLVAAWPSVAPAPEHAPPQDGAARAPDERDPDAAGAIVPLWLAGGEVEVDVDLAAASDIGGMFGDLDVGLEPAAEDNNDEVAPPTAEPGLLPAGDLAWVDRLDDAALERAEHWLAGRKG